jgi:hypothetical protein
MKIVSVIPWWGKIAGKVVLSRLPFDYRIWQRIGLFRHGAMDSSAYSIGVFQKHVQRGGLVNCLKGKTIMELGPGDSIATALIASAFGARAILIDTGAFAREDLAIYHRLSASLHKMGLTPPQLSHARTLDDVLHACEATYLTHGLESLQALQSNSVDFVFSQAVLEHVKRSQFLDVQHECRRIMRENAIASHVIDLRDHLGGNLNNLRFSERIWESHFFSSSGFYTNRIQFTQMAKLFEKAGFSVELHNVRRWPELPTPREKLAAPFSHMQSEELCVMGFNVLLRLERA